MATPCRVDQYDIKTLIGHTFSDVTNRHYVVPDPENLERFAEAQAVIEAALWAKLKPEKKARELKAV